MVKGRDNRDENGNSFPVKLDKNDIGSATNSADNGDGRIQNADSVIDADGNRAEQESVYDSNGDSSVKYVEIDPDKLGEYISGNGADSEPRKRRGRKPGSKNTAGGKKAAQTVEPFLIMAHQWAAVLLKTPEIMLEEKEAKSLSDAYSVFCQHHNVPVISEKRMSEINMIAALALVYGPRIIAVRNRVKEENKLKKAKNVTSFTQGFGVAN